MKTKLINYLFFSLVVISCSKDNSSLDSEKLYLESISNDKISVSASIRSSYNNENELERTLTLNYSNEALPDDIKISDCGYILEGIEEKNDTIIYKNSISNKIKVTTRAFEDDIYNAIKPFLLLQHKDSRKTIFKYSNIIKIDPEFNYDVVVKEISPLSLTVHDTLKIKGSNFCFSGLKKEFPSTIEIFGYQHLVNYESDSLLTAIISPQIIEQISTKTCLLNCGTTNLIDQNISILNYELDSVTKKELFIGDTIAFYGKNFVPELFSSNNSITSKSYIKIGETNISVIQNSSDSNVLRALIPKGLPAKEIDIEFCQLDNKSILSKKYKSTTPYISEPKIYIKYKDTVEVRGKWFSQSNTSDLQFKTLLRGVSQTSKILNDSVIQIIFENSVPTDSEEIDLNKNIQFLFKQENQDLFEINHNQITIEKPTIESYNKNIIPVGEKGIITIKNGAPYAISFNKDYDDNNQISYKNLYLENKENISSLGFYISQINIEGKTITGTVNTIYGDIPFEFKISRPLINSFKLSGSEYVDFIGLNFIPNSNIYVNNVKYNFDHKYSNTSSSDNNSTNFSVQSLGSSLTPGKNIIYTEYEDIKSNIYEFDIPDISINYFDYDGVDLTIKGQNLNTAQLQLFLDNVKTSSKFYSYDNLDTERFYAIYGSSYGLSYRNKRLTLSEYPKIRYLYFSDTITLGKTKNPLKHTFSEKIINNQEIENKNILYRFEFEKEIYCITNSNLYKLNFETKNWDLFYSEFLKNKIITSNKYISKENNFLHFYSNKTIYTFNMENNEWVENIEELNINKTITSFAINNSTLYFFTNESKNNFYSYNFYTKAINQIISPISHKGKIYNGIENLYIYDGNEKNVYIFNLNKKEWISIKQDEGTAGSTYNYKYEASSIYEIGNDIYLSLTNFNTNTYSTWQYIENGNRFVSPSSLPLSNMESVIIDDRIFSFGGVYGWDKEINHKYYVTPVLSY